MSHYQMNRFYSQVTHQTLEIASHRSDSNSLYWDLERGGEGRVFERHDKSCSMSYMSHKCSKYEVNVVLPSQQYSDKYLTISNILV